MKEIEGEALKICSAESAWHRQQAEGARANPAGLSKGFAKGTGEGSTRCASLLEIVAGRLPMRK
jgi:hypothetical protein